MTETAFVKSVLEHKTIKDMVSQNQKPFLFEGLSFLFVRISNLLGIKEPISAINKTDISEMILNHFTSISLEEIDYAFKMERYGQLTPKTEHFQLFNAEYVSAVLLKWKAFKTEKRRTLNLPLTKAKEAKPELTDSDKEFQVITGVMSCFDYFLKENEIELGRIYVYDVLHEKGVLPKHTKRFKESVKRKAIKNLYKKRDTNKRQITKVLKTIQTGENKQITECKRIILKTYFSNLKSKNMHVLDVLKTK